MAEKLVQNPQWIEWKDGICKKVEKYLQIPKTATENVLNENFSEDLYKCKRLSAMFEAILPYCDNYIDTTDDNIKEKVFEVFFQKLDYDQFGDERLVDSENRLDNACRIAGCFVNDIFVFCVVRSVEDERVLRRLG